MSTFSEKLSKEELQEFIDGVDAVMEGHDPTPLDNGDWRCECGYVGDNDDTDYHEAAVLIDALAEQIIALHERQKEEQATDEWRTRINKQLDDLGPLKPG